MCLATDYRGTPCGSTAKASLCTSDAPRRDYSPSYIAWYGLVKLEEHLRELNTKGQDIFLTQVVAGQQLFTTCRRHRGVALYLRLERR